MHITLLDYILLPLYLALFYWRVKKMSNKYGEPDLRKFMLIAFGLRMLGSIAYSMLVQYYYGYGDSFTYYDGGNFFTEQVSKDIGNLTAFFSPFSEMQDWYNSTALDTGLSGHFATPASNLVMRISALLSYLSFNRFLIISIFFGLFSFLGQWKLFLVFDRINNHRNRKLLAFAILYSPSIWFWGSGLLKDSICLGALGFIIHILYKLFVRRKFSLLNLLQLVFLVFVVSIIKAYITSIVAIGLGIMVFSIILKSIKNKFAKVILVIIALGFTAIVLYASDFTAQINEMAEESIIQIQEFQQNYEVLQGTEENSKAGFGLGELDPSLSSLLLKSPGVISTCLFRPFLWESSKLIILFTSLEATLLLIATIYIMLKLGLIIFFRTIFNSPYLLFCFSITMMFALIIGFTTFNFGTMTRYKIIFLPFYHFLLVNLYSIYKSP